MTSYSTFGKSGKRAPHGSFLLCACFFACPREFSRASREPGHIGPSTQKNLTKLHTTNLSRRTSVAFACS